MSLDEVLVPCHDEHIACARTIEGSPIMLRIIVAVVAVLFVAAVTVASAAGSQRRTPAVGCSGGPGSLGAGRSDVIRR